MQSAYLTQKEPLSIHCSTHSFTSLSIHYFHYIWQRAEAVTEVEKTIVELGSLFTRLTTMISEQQELVERVDQGLSH
jgi:hypothetical protein